MGAKRKAKKQLAVEAEKQKIQAREAQKALVEQVAKDRRAQHAAAAQAAQQRKLAAMTPDQRASYERRQAIMGVFVIVVVFVAVGGCIYSAATNDDDAPEASEEVAEAAPDAPEDADPAVAFEICKNFVKDELRAPGTASFRNYYEDDGEVQVEVDGNEVTIVSTVDAENGFGGEVREPFVCTVREEGDDRWRAVSVVVG